MNRWDWILASVLGALIGDLIAFNTVGIDFTLTALFIVIFLNQLMKPKAERAKYPREKIAPAEIAPGQSGGAPEAKPLRTTRISALIGVGCSLVSLLVFGPSSFIIPAMALISRCFPRS